jgi:sulfonate transport system permease protein
MSLSSLLRPLQRLASPLLLLAAWQLLSSLGWISDEVIAAPLQILQSFGHELTDGPLLTNLGVSLGRVAIAISCALVIGTSLALASGLNRFGENAIDPVVQILRSLPFLGLIPLFIIWFGIGEFSKLALITFGATFPIYLNLFAGLRGVDVKLLEAGRMLGLPRRQIITAIALPAALPSFLVGLRYSIAIAWLSLVVVEQVNASSGLGYMINDARDFMRTDIILICLCVYGLLGLTSDALIRALESRLLAWRPKVVK